MAIVLNGRGRRLRPSHTSGASQLAALLLGAALLPAARADTITITLDSVDRNSDSKMFEGTDDGPFAKTYPKGLPFTDDKLGQGKFRPEQFTKSIPTNAANLGDGTIFKNSSGKAISDLELILTGNNKFAVNQAGKPLSTGGGAFSSVTVSADGKTLTFSGGDIKPGSYVWANIPKLSNDTYMAMITPPQKEVPPAPKTPSGPEFGNGGANPGNSPKMNFVPGAGGTGTLSLTPGSINFGRYLDGTMAGPGETILGAALSVAPMTLIGHSATMPGAFDFSDTSFTVQGGSNLFLQGTLTDVFLAPSTSFLGFDSILQGTLVWDAANLGLGSRMLNELYGPDSADTGLALFFPTNLLSNTENLSISGSSSGAVFISGAVPEPESWVLFAAGLLGVMTAFLKRCDRACDDGDRGGNATRVR